MLRDGVLAGIIDWGDLCVGDIATDLASAWMLFAESDQRDEFLASYGGVSENTRYRAEGWAISLGTTLLDTGPNNNRRHEVVGRRTLANVASRAL